MSKLNIQTVPEVEDRSLPVFAEFDELMERIRQRAYSLFAGRGFGDGNAVGDWLTAEREICWPAAELVEKDDEFELKVALAGFATGEIEVTANPRELFVKAARRTKKSPRKDDKSEVRWTEFHSDDVYRRVELPYEVDVDKVSASFKDGLLKVEAPKAAEAKTGPKEVEISTAA